jgi:hypothetical protein
MDVGRSKGHFAFSLNLEREQGLAFGVFFLVCNTKPDRRWAAAIACAAPWSFSHVVCSDRYTVGGETEVFVS